MKLTLNIFNNVQTIQCLSREYFCSYLAFFRLNNFDARKPNSVSTECQSSDLLSLLWQIIRSAHGNQELRMNVIQRFQAQSNGIYSNFDLMQERTNKNIF
jgi:hypothetical protein